MRNDIAQLSEQITSALNDFAGKASGEARRSYGQARANADDLMSDWSQRGAAFADQAYDTAVSLEESLEESIAERPLAAVGLAAAVGILIGMTFRR